MNDTVIEVDNEDDACTDEEDSIAEVETDAQVDPDCTLSKGGGSKKNKGKNKNKKKMNQSPNKKKWDNNNNKNDNNSKDQNSGGDKGSPKSNNNGKKGSGNSGDKNENTFIKQIYSLIEGLCRGSKNYPLDSPILFLLYRCIFLILVKVCLIVWYNLYFRDTIVCVSGFNAADKIEDFILNICLSYPYLNAINGPKRFLLYYRWIPYVLAHLFIMAYIPRLIMKWFNNSKLHHLLQDLANASQWYDNSHYKKLEDKLYKYFDENLGTHIHLYFIYVLNHLFAISLVASYYYMLDYLLQGRFLYLPFDTIPLVRDPKTFTDQLSTTFPPFVQCLVAPPLNMKNERSEEYNCHLTLMEFYEKFFFILWFILFYYLVILCLTVCLLVILLMPYCNRFFLRTANKSKGLALKKYYLLNKLNSGDIFALYLVKKRTSDAQFCSLIAFVYAVHRKQELALSEERHSKEERIPSRRTGLETPDTYGFPPNLRYRG